MTTDLYEHRFNEAISLAHVMYKTLNKSVHIYVDTQKIEYYLSTIKVKDKNLQYIAFYPYHNELVPYKPHPKE